MSVLLKCHEQLTNGVGRCSVSMWMNGGPAGFCDALAYGKQLPYEVHYDNYGDPFRFDRKYAKQAPALACANHAGPTLQEAIAGKVAIRFDGPPGPESGRFVEAEMDGKSINIGVWMQDGDDWILVLDCV